MKKNFIYWLALGFLVITGCQKELSFEQGSTPAVGTLQSDLTGDCLPKTVNGTYEAAKALVPATNTITIQVDVTRTGVYTITTDTVNGYYFRATGTFTTLGINTVTLRSNGTPFAQGINNFVISYDGNTCDIAVTVLPAGAGGPADFTLDGATSTGGSCTGAVVNGSYATTIPLSASNTVTLMVNVTKIGTYLISTDFKGMHFEASGAFLTAVPQTVTLNGSGTPTTAGLNTVPITVGTTTCSFPVTVASPATGTLGGAGGTCTPSTPNGTYTKDVALTAANTVQVQIDVITAGVYSVTTNTVQGFHFSGTGIVAVGPGQLITLAGGGTPTQSGPQTFNVTFGTSTCTFTVNVDAPPAPPVVDWEFTMGATTYKGTTEDAIQQTSGGLTVLNISGTQDNGIGTIGINLSNTSGGISTGVYSGTATSGKFAVFIFTDGATGWLGGPTFGNLPVNLTVYNTTTHIVQGTFAGTVTDGTSNFTISGGKFKANFP